ncbi:MAG: GNAT family protein [Chitinophagales bacterium]
MNFTPFPKLTTERLSLRKINKGDINEIYTLRSDENILKYIAQAKAKSIEDAEKFITMINNGIEDNKWLFWGITLEESADIIGTICIWNIQKENFRAEIGYSMLTQFQGKGYMTEAIKKIIDFSFSNLKMHSLEAHVHPNNLASIQVLKKNGFIKEAHLKDNIFFEGKFMDTSIYSLIDPNARKS